MILNDLELGKKAIIVNVTATGELKHRLYSFGLVPNTEIIMKNMSFNRANLQVYANRTFTNLRAEEAQLIDIEELL